MCAGSKSCCSALQSRGNIFASVRTHARTHARTRPRFILQVERTRGKFLRETAQQSLQDTQEVSKGSKTTNRKRAARKKEERTKRSLTHRERTPSSGGPRCTMGAPGTAFVWILGRLSCLIRYGLEIRPPRADSGEGAPRTKPGNGGPPFDSPRTEEFLLYLPFALTPPSSLISLPPPFGRGEGGREGEPLSHPPFVS